MSFRVKASHGFLKSVQAAPQPQQQKSLDDLLQDGQKKYDWSNYSNSQQTKSAVYVPASNAHVNQSKGLVIRPNPRAQEDYM